MDCVYNTQRMFNELISEAGQTNTSRHTRSRGREGYIDTKLGGWMDFIDTEQGLNVAWSSATGCGLVQPLNEQYNLGHAPLNGRYPRSLERVSVCVVEEVRTRLLPRRRRRRRRRKTYEAFKTLTLCLPPPKYIRDV